MDIERIETGPIMSQVVIHNGTAYLAGQVAWDHAGKSVAEQTQEILGRIDALLERAGSSKDKLLSATILLTDKGDFLEMNKVWEEWLSPGSAPARTTMEAQLLRPGWSVEITAIASC